MRTVPSQMLPGAVREIGGYAVLRNRLPVFSEGNDTDYFFHAHDVDGYSTGAFRAASVSSLNRVTDEAFLYTKNIPNLSNVNSILIRLESTGIQTYPLSGLSVRSGFLFYHKANGDVVRRSIATQDESVYFNMLSDIGIAAVSDTEIYVIYRLTDTTFTVRRHNGSGWASTWSGAIYGEGFVPASLDAERIDGVDYILWQNADKRNARILRCKGSAWGDSELVLPLDVVDDTFQFRLGSVSVIDNRLVVVGTLVRNNSSMKIYTFGPDHFTLGRELFIARGRVSERVINGKEVTMPIGKMLLIDEMLYVFGGDNRFHTAEATVLFGCDRADQKSVIDINSVTLDSEANRPARAVFEVKSSLQDPLLKSGNLIDWYARVNGIEARLGRFAIDMVSGSSEEMGETKSIVARSLSMKNLATWQSDSSFDYWSQTKLTTKASDLGKVIRGGGEWEEVEQEGSVRFKDFNLPGVLHAVEKATRNGTAVGEFRVDASANYRAKYGVAICYHRETAQDAKARLGEEISPPYDAVNHGLFFTVDSSSGSSALYRVIDGEWTALASGSEPIFTNDWHWLRIDFRDGRVRCYYRAGIYWIKVIDRRVSTDALHPYPWFTDEVGKAALYLENVTPNAKSYPFDLQATYVPVLTVDPFPNSGTIKVDSEFITYNGKSVERTLGTEADPLKWVKGYTWKDKDQPHLNTLIYTGIKHYVDYPANSGWHYGHAAEFRGGSFLAADSWKISSIDVYLKKVGTADAYAEIWLGNDDSDNGLYPPDSTILGKCKRLFKYGSASNMLGGSGTFYGGEGWVRFNISATLKKGEAYFVYLVNKGGLNIPSEGYFNIATRNVSGRCHIRGPWPTWNVEWGNTLAMRINGSGGSVAIPGYEIYCDTVGTQRAINYYNDCVLACIDGPGKGRAMKITGYDYHAPHQWVPNNPSDTNWQSYVGDLSKGKWVDKKYRRFFVSANVTTAFGEGSKFVVTPSLKVTQRGANDSTPTAHAASIASLVGGMDTYNEGAEARTFEYYSSERDMTLGWMLKEIARKANVLDISQEMRLSGNYPTTYDFDFTKALLNARQGESAIVDFNISLWGSGGIGLAVFAPGDGVGSDVQSVAVLVYENSVRFYRYEDGNIILLQNFPTPESITGNFTISFQKDVFSVWNNGRFLIHFFWTESEAQDTIFDRGYSVGVINDLSVTCTVAWSELDSRVDNYILDIGQAGIGLAQGLVGEKRVYFLDDQDGNLKLFRNRREINPDVPQSLQVAQAESLIDTNVKTRLRSEGVEIVETADYEALAEHGNLFTMIGLREPNNIAETVREMALILEDALRSHSETVLIGAADPRVEPEDLLLVALKPDNHKFIRLTGVSFRLVGGSNPLFDMQLTGSVWKDGNLRAPSFTSDSQAVMTTDKEQVITITTDGLPFAQISIKE